MDRLPELTSTCFYRMNDAYCYGGWLARGPVVVGNKVVEPEYIKVGDELVLCPACEGTMKVLTPAGKDLARFLNDPAIQRLVRHAEQQA
jgi:hypothetical protein